MKCSCCRKKAEIVRDWVSPTVGYGSWFDTISEKQQVECHLCKRCADKIDAWLTKQLSPGVKLEALWASQPVTVIEEGKFIYQQLYYEPVFMDMFLKFMPWEIFTKHPRISALIWRWRGYGTA